jgi:hypothetical protein
LLCAGRCKIRNMNIIETIKKQLSNDLLFGILLPKIKHQIENPDPKYGVISPMYSLMPCFFDYYNVEELSNEQMKEADKVIKIVDDAFGGGWSEISAKISQEQDLRTNEIIRELKHTKSVLQVLES